MYIHFVKVHQIKLRPSGKTERRNLKEYHSLKCEQGLKRTQRRL